MAEALAAAALPIISRNVVNTVLRESKVLTKFAPRAGNAAICGVNDGNFIDAGRQFIPLTFTRTSIFYTVMNAG
jgi:hypothetical protein